MPNASAIHGGPLSDPRTNAIAENCGYQINWHVPIDMRITGNMLSPTALTGRSTSTDWWKPYFNGNKPAPAFAQPSL
jgi:hypothetical protein